MNKSSVLFIPHGGGPMPLLGEPRHQKLVEFLKIVPSMLGMPKAILLVSAHWEEKIPTITSGNSPELIYDYSGFPEESYQIKYPAPGSSALAQRVNHLLSKNGVESKLDSQRGFDHGLFVPLKLMYPEAKIPCVQLSLVKSLDPKIHIEIGKALAELRNENILIIGSGFSFHNMNAFFTNNQIADSKNEAFQDWLIDTCTSEKLSFLERENRLVNWSDAPFAKYCHPREEHLLPLHVCFGAGNSEAKVVFKADVLGKKTCAFLW